MTWPLSRRCDVAAVAAEGRAWETAVIGPADADGTLLSLPKDLHEEAPGQWRLGWGRGLLLTRWFCTP